jgi:UDP-N-acetylmuramate--alanine ligase
MRKLPIDIGIIHFVGIGGIGMSGIAETLHNLQYDIQGSDISESPNVGRLRHLGIKVSIGQEAQNIENASIVVVSTAIKFDNLELLAARKLQIPIVHRAEMLAELMRLKWSIACAGTHGKTTTTSLVAAMLDAAKLDPTVINGGIINSYGTNARIGAGDWMVVEADESDGTFNKLPATIAIVTNIDPEHLDFHGDFEHLKNAFKEFITNLPFYGFAVVCLDHPVVKEVISQVADRRIITYGVSKDSDVRVSNITNVAGGTFFDVEIRDKNKIDSNRMSDLMLPMFGRHNVLNALASVAVASEMGVPEATIREALQGFQGVKRRFTKTGEVNSITIIDDYGHHPVEIAAALDASRLACGNGKVIAIVQPHRFTRLRDLFDDFCACFFDADIVFVTDVYSAGEISITGFDKENLVAGINKSGSCQAFSLEDPISIATKIAEIASPKDFVVFLGAGNITELAQKLPKQLEHIFSIEIDKPSNEENFEKNDPVVALKLTEKKIKAAVTK